MTYYTESELRARGGLTASAAEQVLSKSARAARGSYDVFLSHSKQDAPVILGLKKLLERQGLAVYVDWIDDPELDRSNVSPRTASRLRDRMRTSRSMVYATSRSASQSRWMPWELGYFDGVRGGNYISICPIESSSTHGFVGEEYLGLYKTLEKLTANGLERPFTVRRTKREAESVESFVRGNGDFVPIRA